MLSAFGKGNLLWHTIHFRLWLPIKEPGTHAPQALCILMIHLKATRSVNSSVVSKDDFDRWSSCSSSLYLTVPGMEAVRDELFLILRSPLGRIGSPECVAILR